MLKQQAQERHINSISREAPWEIPDLDLKTTPSQSWQLPLQLHSLLERGVNPKALRLASPHAKPAQL